MPTSDAQEIVVVALYKFADLPDYRALREPLLSVCESFDVKGSLLLAGEGINGTIAGSRGGVDKVLAHLRRNPGLAELEHMESYANEIPFYRMKVLLKKEIVTMGVPEVDPSTRVGTYVLPSEWNALVRDPDTILIDTRNDYEIEIGTFAGALDPALTQFREFPDYVRNHLDPGKHKKVAMFCTGGIRCEKASSFLLHEGFQDVYHLRGGILRYLEEVPENESEWEGDCFVFDERVAVDHELRPAGYDLCRGCRWPVSEVNKQSPKYEEGICCPHCHHLVTDEKRKSRAERHRQVQLAKERGDAHVGKRFPRI